MDEALRPYVAVFNMCTRPHFIEGAGSILLNLKVSPSLCYTHLGICTLPCYAVSPRVTGSHSVSVSSRELNPIILKVHLLGTRSN